MIKTLVIIPAYNEEGNIEKLMKKLGDFKYDYLVINDASSDETNNILKTNNINHLSLVNNMGIANVVQIGYKYAYDNGYDAAVTIDGDGQHNPLYISKLLEEIEKGEDYVVGSRFVTEKKPFNARMIGSRLLCLCVKLVTGRTVTDPTSGMKVLGKNVLKDFSDGTNFVAEPDTLVYLIRNKFKVKEIQVEMHDRENGESHFNTSFNSIKFMLFVLMSIIFVQWRKAGEK